MPRKRMGDTEAAVAADVAHYDLDRFPTARPLAAAALVLARRLDADPNAAVARELRLALDALARATAAQANDELETLLAELNSPIDLGGAE